MLDPTGAHDVSGCPHVKSVNHSQTKPLGKVLKFLLMKLWLVLPHTSEAQYPLHENVLQPKELSSLL